MAQEAGGVCPQIRAILLALFDKQHKRRCRNHFFFDFLFAFLILNDINSVQRKIFFPLHEIIFSNSVCTCIRVIFVDWCNDARKGATETVYVRLNQVSLVDEMWFDINFIRTWEYRTSSFISWFDSCKYVILHSGLVNKYVIIIDFTKHWARAECNIRCLHSNPVGKCLIALVNPGDN